MLDLILRGGRIIDGTGSAWFFGDVGIQGDTIVALGDLRSMQAARVIDVAGAVVAPGFVDIHTHSDLSLLVNPRGESKIRQGVTTEVVGNCGISYAPLAGTAADFIAADMAEYQLPLTWRSMSEYMDELQGARPSLNVAVLIGLGLIRRGVVGDDDRPATPEEMDAMRALVAAGMADGAFGISSGLIYAPGCFADTAELTEMAKVAHQYGGFYATHMRNESDKLTEAVAEAIAIGEGSGAPVEISHHKAVGVLNWGKVKDSLALIEEARSRGVDVTCDQYPYTASATGLAESIPMWAHDGGREALLARLSDPVTRARIAQEAHDETMTLRKGWDKLILTSAGTPKYQHLEGKDFDQIGLILGLAPVEAMIEIVLASGATAGRVGFGMCEEDVAYVMRHPLTMIGSDGNAIAPYGLLSHGKPHPRSYGTFARVLGRYVRDLKVLPLEEAVRKMTSLPCRKLGLWDRGILRPGMKADITVFDPDTVADRADFVNPHQYADGVAYVIVNGTVVIDGGEHTGAHTGTVLRKSR
jgi:N-acyl-D-amino-acid deacylase